MYKLSIFNPKDNPELVKFFKTEKKEKALADYFKKNLPMVSAYVDTVGFNRAVKTLGFILGKNEKKYPKVSNYLKMNIMRLIPSNVRKLVTFDVEKGTEIIDIRWKRKVKDFSYLLDIIEMLYKKGFKSVKLYLNGKWPFIYIDSSELEGFLKTKYDLNIASNILYLSPYKVDLSQFESDPELYPYKVGDILDGTWGYEQTNVIFYQVTGVGKSSFKLREVRVDKKYTGDMVGVATPKKGMFTGEVLTKKLPTKGSEGAVRINRSLSVSPWDGRPVDFSEYA